ncbi:hypothetical protein TNCV_4127061 [Trichonephila clavipes]|uniref:Transposase n=1 Tax=Trichonephila clavipes TaxID=2585209 RepID=A0A8X6SSR0_TRICX|nr:hypothetical protein TNCV_4127061 [Trichonephila clavipes]
MENKKEISTSERKINVKMWKDGKSRRDRARSVGRQYPSIQHIIYNFKSTRVYTSKPILSRPSKLTIREKRSPRRPSQDLLERRIRQHNVSSKDMLKSLLKDQWEKPGGHDHEHKSGVRALGPLKPVSVDELMHVKSIQAQCPHVSVVWKFGEEVYSSGVVIVT